MEEKKAFFDWVKAHKVELILVSVAIVSTVLVIKNWDSIKGLFIATEQNNLVKLKVDPMSIEAAPSISSDFIDNLTGNKSTATELGNKVWCSAQAINNRIVAAGLATKLPCGEYSLSDTGRLLGESTLKTTRAGHSFSNIEWDEKILEVIFSQEELLEIATKQECTKKILERAIG